MDPNIGEKVFIHGNNLSEAWARVFIKCNETPGGIIAPCIVRFNIYDSEEKTETESIRHLLSERLIEHNEKSINTVANTIFPETIWKLSKGNREKFYDLYDKLWPQIKKCRANNKGVYFRRLTSFGTFSPSVNQLEHILKTWNEKNNHRHSALQAGIFDPYNDHSHQWRLGFPCLQQVIFHPNGSNGKDGLSIVALYANQILLEKAYGNYLGLYRLCKFMAQEMGLKVKDVTCIASNLKISDTHGTKKENKPLTEALKKELSHGE